MGDTGVFKWDGCDLSSGEPNCQPWIVFWRNQPPPTAKRLRATFVLLNTTANMVAYHFDTDEYSITPNNGVLLSGVPRYVHASIRLDKSRERRLDTIYLYLRNVCCCQIDRGFWRRNVDDTKMARIRVSFHQGMKGKCYFSNMPKLCDYPPPELPRCPTCHCGKAPAATSTAKSKKKKKCVKRKKCKRKTRGRSTSTRGRSTSTQCSSRKTRSRSRSTSRSVWSCSSGRGRSTARRVSIDMPRCSSRSLSRHSSLASTNLPRSTDAASSVFRSVSLSSCESINVLDAETEV